MTARARPACRGIGLVDLLVAVALGSIVLLGLNHLLDGALGAYDAGRQRVELARQADYALQRISSMLGGTRRLLVPLRPEQERDVLAFTLDPTRGSYYNGVWYADADNDRDGKIDEDLGADNTNDGQPGIAGIDDDGDGLVDEGGAGSAADDDEDAVVNEENARMKDRDGDAALGEDIGGDMSGLSAGAKDDDGDGRVDEDWLDPVVYRLADGSLWERLPNVGAANGLGYTERQLVTQVKRFAVTRIGYLAGNRGVLVRIALTLAAGDETVTRRATLRLRTVN